MSEESKTFDNWTDEEKWQFLTRHEKLGEVLVRQRLLTLEQLEQLLQEQGSSSGMHIGQLIVARGIATLDAILAALNQQHISDKVSLESIIELQSKHGQNKDS
jgi:hypothetical protein